MHPPELRGGMGRGASKARTSYRMLDKRGLQRQWDPPPPLHLAHSLQRPSQEVLSLD